MANFVFWFVKYQKSSGQKWQQIIYGNVVAVALVSFVCGHKDFCSISLVVVTRRSIVCDMVWDWFWGFQLIPISFLGAKKGILIFFQYFLCFFINYFPCKENCQMNSWHHVLSLTVFELQGGEIDNTQIFDIFETFHLSIHFDGFSSKDSL